MLSIMVMGATVTLFGVVGDRINAGRAMIETSDRVRAVENLLHKDVSGVTVPLVPWGQPSAGNGYFEILKGGVQTKNRELAYNNPDGTPNVLLGYTQDALMFTTRSPDQPFVGRYVTPNGQTSTFESPIAEVVWFMQPTFNPQGQVSNPPTCTLYRRQLLVLPSPTALKLNGTGAAGLLNYYDNYDVSAHPDSNGYMWANSLADLTYRDNRFAHNTSSPPYFVNFTSELQQPKTFNDYSPYSLAPFQPPFINGGTNPIGSQRYGEDVMLTNVLSFDVKVWDPGAPVLVDNDATAPHPLVPSDPGYQNGKALNPPQYGAFVDLNWKGGLYTPASGAPQSFFAGPYFGLGQKSLLGAGNTTNGFATYDIWCQGYEYAPSYQPANIANGFDDDGANGVDDPLERISSPPYPVPLRGIQIKIRVYEPSTRQVREVTVTETFMPD